LTAYLNKSKAVAMKNKKTKFKIHLIRKAMKDQGFDQTTLAAKIKISKQLLSYYLKNPSMNGIWQIAYALKLDLWDLIK